MQKLIKLSNTHYAVVNEFKFKLYPKTKWEVEFDEQGKIILL